MVVLLPKAKIVDGLEVITGAQAPDFPPPPTKNNHHLPGKPTDDQIGDVLINEWDGRYAFFYGAWYGYQNGVWLPMRPNFEIWEMMKHLRRSGCHDLRPSATRVAGVEAYLMEYLRADEPPETLNYINLRNGVYNLETGSLEPHRRELFMTSQLPFDYESGAGMSVFSHFLQSAIVTSEGDTDWQTIKVLQEAMGYSLTANTDYRVSFWLVGASGTGKSVLINVLTALAGNSHVPIDLDTLTNNPYQLADVAGKRVVTFTEPKANGVLADGHYKRLVSQDKIMARHIFGTPFAFVPVCKVWGAMNETPRVIDRSDAVFNRVIIINMNRVVPLAERDLRLNIRLEAELAGIFNWALSGLIRLQRAGKFSHSDQIEQARADYKLENDNEAMFINECGKLDADESIKAQILYDAYADWCKRNGMMAKTSTRVARDWLRLGFTKEHTRMGTRWHGITLRSQNEMWGIT